jgi:hypothetical protein
MVHVAERHIVGGALARGRRDVFPANMNAGAVERAIR